jgi:hypothetical protein
MAPASSNLRFATDSSTVLITLTRLSGAHLPQFLLATESNSNATMANVSRMTVSATGTMTVQVERMNYFSALLQLRLQDCRNAHLNNSCALLINRAFLNREFAMEFRTVHEMRTKLLSVRLSLLRSLPNQSVVIQSSDVTMDLVSLKYAYAIQN